MANVVTNLTPPGNENGGNGSYTGENIKILEGLEAVRLRPAMYIGSTGEMGLHHLVYEVVDNSVDEALAGYAKKIDVVIHVDNSITVVDDGRGIPVDMMDLAQRREDAGGAGGADQAACGRQVRRVDLQGLGRAARRGRELRERAERRSSTWRSGATAHTWEMDFSCGLPTSELRKAGTSKRRGTKVHFLPDKSIFAATEFNYDTLAQRLREMAFLNKGLEITLTDERTADPKTGRGEAGGVPVRGRHCGVCEAPEPRQAGAARQADRDGGHARRRGDRDRAAVQRQLLRDGVQLCQQHQHGGRRLASFGFPDLADADHQRDRAAAGAVQGHEGKPERRRRARGAGGGGEREAVAAAV